MVCFVLLLPATHDEETGISSTRWQLLSYRRKPSFEFRGEPVKTNFVPSPSASFAALRASTANRESKDDAWGNVKWRRSFSFTTCQPDTFTGFPEIFRNSSHSCVAPVDAPIQATSLKMMGECRGAPSVLNEHSLYGVRANSGSASRTSRNETVVIAVSLYEPVRMLPIEARRPFFCGGFATTESFVSGIFIVPSSSVRYTREPASFSVSRTRG